MPRSGEEGLAAQAEVVCTAERVFAADPARVWALVADPARVGEWGAVETVGYLGTELPRVGQIVFVRTHRWQSAAGARRVEISGWEAGSSYLCVLGSSRFAAAAEFEVEVTPRVTHAGIATEVLLKQWMEVRRIYAPAVRLVVNRSLRRKLDRIGRAVAE